MLSHLCSLFSSAGVRGPFHACSCAASPRDSFEQMLKMTDEARSGVYRKRINRTEKGEGGGERERDKSAPLYTQVS
jgi:hypothetical protein